MQKIRITFSKGEELKYISHLDLMRSLERAMRRAEIPLAYSQGFHPRPRLIIALPLSVGMSGSAELADLVLEKRMDTEEFVRRLSLQLPEGLKIKEAEEILPVSLPVAHLIKAVTYEVKVCGQNLPSRQELEKNIEELLRNKEIILRQETKRGIKEFDLRSLIREIKPLAQEKNTLTLKLSFAIGGNDFLKIEEIIRRLIVEAKILEVKRSCLMFS